MGLALEPFIPMHFSKKTLRDETISRMLTGYTLHTGDSFLVSIQPERIVRPLHSLINYLATELNKTVFQFVFPLPGGGIIGNFT